jgi:hypothetical protein
MACEDHTLRAAIAPVPPVNVPHTYSLIILIDGGEFVVDENI